MALLETSLPSEHPSEEALQRFARGELPRDEVREVVRHLLTGCPQCLQVTRPLWELADRPLLSMEETA